MRKTLKILPFILLLFGDVCYAQNLPKIQNVSLWAPVPVKIDGKVNEWGDRFMAYNNHIEAYYIIANDNDNLYLVVHSANAVITQKLTVGGVVFTVNASKKTVKGGVVITYPVIGAAQ